MSLEGVVPITTIARNTVVSETRIVQAPAEAVAAAMLERPRFDRPLPALLAKGFPRPIATASTAHTIRVAMRGGEMRLNGMEPQDRHARARTRGGAAGIRPLARDVGRQPHAALPDVAIV